MEMGVSHFMLLARGYALYSSTPYILCSLIAEVDSCALYLVVAGVKGIPPLLTT